MNKVPPKSLIEKLEGGTEGLDDDEIIARIRQLDELYRLK